MLQIKDIRFVDELRSWAFQLLDGKFAWIECQFITRKNEDELQSSFVVLRFGRAADPPDRVSRVNRRGLQLKP